MEQNTPTPQPTPAPKAPPSYGGLFAIIIILVAIVIGALYFWGERIAKQPTPPNPVESLETQSNSSEPADIQADLEAESPDSFGADMDAAFTEIEAALNAE